MKELYIYGASGHGLVVSDIAKACGYDNIIFIDDRNEKYQSFDEIKANSDIPIALGIGDNFIRKELYVKLKKNNFEILTLIHPSAIISESSKIGDGTVIMPNVVINARVKIGNGVILNSLSVIEHESNIKDFVHISPNVSLAGNVSIERFTHLGISSCVIQGISIGENCIIGAGSVVVNDIKDNIKAYGNPCKMVEEINER